MDTERTSNNAISFEETAQKQWYLSMRPATPKQTLHVTFDDDKSYAFLGTNKVNIGDPVIIDYGGASSYKMGVVSDAVNGITIKRTHALKPLFVFTTDPGKTELKKNAQAMNTLEENERLEDIYISVGKELSKNGFHLIDYLVSGVLNAISVVAFPKLVGESAVLGAKEYLAKEKNIPGYIFGRDSTDYFNNAICLAWTLPEYDDECEFSLTGYYPGWKEELLGCSIWNEKLGRMNACWDEREKAYLLYLKNGSTKLQSIFGKSDDFRKMTNELVFRSAFSILIRGGFANLLEAALSTQMPIIDFYDDLVSFAKEIESMPCYELLKDTDYKNKKFEVSTKKVGKSEKKIDNKVSKAFKIKDGVLLKYSGDEEVVAIPDGVKVIGDQSFEGLHIKKVIMPDSVTKIEGKPFYGGMNVEEIVFSKKLSSIAPYAFAGVKSLKTVDLSNTKLKTIRKRCFMDCSSLETVKLPQKLKSIEEYAFSGIAAKEMVFPASVEKIVNNAIFPVWGYKETSFTDLYFEGTAAIDFILPGREYPLRIHCKRGCPLWRMLEDQNEYNLNSIPAFGGNKNVAAELIEY